MPKPSVTVAGEIRRSFPQTHCWPRLRPDFRGNGISNRGSDVLEVFSFGQGVNVLETPLEVVDMRLSATFEGGGHERRIQQIEGMKV